MSDITAKIAPIIERIASSAAAKTPLQIQGGGSKKFYGNPAVGELLDLSSLDGVLAYEPSELYITVAAATPLSKIESLLAENGQMFAFEPPHFAPKATIGGITACGLSGPRRTSAGALRDHILGVALIDGSGQQLRFGGTVLKNVAGFDVSRLMAGALGTLGALTEITFRTAPKPEQDVTAVIECAAEEAIDADNEMLGAGLPLSGSVWHGGMAWRRFSGGEESVRRAVQEIGGDVLTEEEQRDFWHSVLEQTHEFFGGDDDLWRLTAPATAPLSFGDNFIEWQGAVRWRRGTNKHAQASALAAGGAATLFRSADAGVGDRFPPLAEPVAKIHQKLKSAFDPSNILNRGRLYEFSDG